SAVCPSVSSADAFRARRAFPTRRSSDLRRALDPAHQLPLAEADHRLLARLRHRRRAGGGVHHPRAGRRRPHRLAAHPGRDAGHTASAARPGVVRDRGEPPGGARARHQRARRRRIAAPDRRRRTAMSIDRLSLRARLLLTVLLPVLLLSVAMTGVTLFRGARLADSEITERGLAIVSFLAPAAEYGVISGSRGSLDGLMLALKAQTDVAAAMLYDRRGDELARLGEPVLYDAAGARRAIAAVRLQRQGARVGFVAPVFSM